MATNDSRERLGGDLDGLILRTARKTWACEGSGGRPTRREQGSASRWPARSPKQTGVASFSAAVRIHACSHCS